MMLLDGGCRILPSSCQFLPHTHSLRRMEVATYSPEPSRRTCSALLLKIDGGGSSVISEKQGTYYNTSRDFATDFVKILCWFGINGPGHTHKEGLSTNINHDLIAIVSATRSSHSKETSATARGTFMIAKLRLELFHIKALFKLLLIEHRHSNHYSSVRDSLLILPRVEIPTLLTIRFLMILSLS